MPDAGKIVAALQQALNALGEAESWIAEARAGATTVEARTTEVGFLAMAAGMRQLGEQLDRVRRPQISVVVDVVAAITAAEQVRADMRPADVIARLTPAARHISTGSAGGIVREIATARGQVNESLKGGTPHMMLDLLENIERAITQTVAHLEAAKARTEEVIAEAKELGNFLVGVAA